jgi:hypothetical protein
VIRVVSHDVIALLSQIRVISSERDGYAGLFMSLAASRIVSSP